MAAKKTGRLRLGLGLAAGGVDFFHLILDREKPS
jgi:hypothetical protein